MKSECCNADMRVDTADEGTACYMCEACGNPCDPKSIYADCPKRGKPKPICEGCGEYDYDCTCKPNPEEG